MQDIELLDKSVLLSALKHSKKDIAILVGAPISAAETSGAPGVPNVSGMIEIIEDHLKQSSDELLNSYRLKVTNTDPIEKYQSSFKFVKNHLGQDEVNEVIVKATLKSVKEGSRSKSTSELNRDEEAWHLPTGTDFLTKCIVKSEKIRGPIITTNFDPLISIALKKNGANSHQTILPSDGDIKQHRTIDDKNVQIVHLHGYWADSETLHTPDQLARARPKLKSSLASIIKNKTLLVIAYGGWDDIFMDALTQLAVIDEEKIDILWAFYESNAEVIHNKYKKLLSTTEEANSKGRFRAFKGINCHDFFKDLYEQITQENKKNKKVQFFDENIDKEIIKNPKIPHWRFHYEPAHDFIRETETFQLKEILKEHKVINISSEWGLAKLPFISSFIKNNLNKENSQKVYYVNLEGNSTRDDILSSAKTQLGVELSQLAVYEDENKSLIILDNIEIDISSEEQRTTPDIVMDLSMALTEFNDLLNIILISRKPILESPKATLTLDKLNDYDIKKYVENHSENKSKTCSSLFLDKVIQISNGIPMKIDKLLADLSIASFEEVIEHNNHPQPYDLAPSEPIPSAINKIISDISDSKNTDDQKTYKILKVLSVLSFGDTFTNLKKIYPTAPFTMGHFALLKSRDLIQSNEIYDSELEHEPGSSKYDFKVMSIPPAIRDFIFGRMKNEEVYDIINKAAECHFGPNWRIGRIKLSSSTEHLVKSGNKNIGSSQIIVIHLLRYALEKGDKNEIIRAVNVATAFSMTLDTYSRFKEVTHFSEEVFSLLKDYPEDIDLVNIKICYGKSLRMISEYEKARESLSKTLSSSTNISNINKGKIHINLAFIFDKLGDSEMALKSAREAMKFVGKKNSIYKSAETIIVNLSEENRLQKLRRLESSARSKKYIVNANNIAIDISKEKISQEEKIGCYDRIINSDGDFYNKFRAIGKKWAEILESESQSNISSFEKSILYTSYLYSHSQRMSGIFADAHKAIWLHFKREKNFSGLVNLFKLSSLYWRISGEIKREKYYAVDLTKTIMSFLKDDGLTMENRYVKFRIEQIS